MQNHNTKLPSCPSRVRRRYAVFAAVLAVAAVSAACGGGDDTAGASGDPTVEIAAPAPGAPVGEEFEVALDLNFPIGGPDTGRQHIHLHYDGSSEYDIVYEETHQVTSLDAGPHTIVAVVANADHSETDSRSAELSVEVTDGSAGAGSTVVPPATTGGGGGFDY